MKCDKGVWGTVLVFANATFVAGCATGMLDDPSQWWNASVVDVVRGSQIPAGVNRDCVPARAEGDSLDEDSIVVVRRRIGRARIFKAFAVPEPESFRVGDRVLVQPDSCRIKRGPSRRD